MSMSITSSTTPRGFGLALDAYIRRTEEKLSAADATEKKNEEMEHGISEVMKHQAFSQMTLHTIKLSLEDKVHELNQAVSPGTS